jgi:hypothetical protein
MNSRERVRKAIRFEAPDRAPIDVGGSLVTGICIDEYVDLVRQRPCITVAAPTAT